MYPCQNCSQTPPSVSSFTYEPKWFKYQSATIFIVINLCVYACMHLSPFFSASFSPLIFQTCQETLLCCSVEVQNIHNKVNGIVTKKACGLKCHLFLLKLHSLHTVFCNLVLTLWFCIVMKSLAGKHVLTYDSFLPLPCSSGLTERNSGLIVVCMELTIVFC